jgi:D-alanine-D-alanine ligase
MEQYDCVVLYNAASIEEVDGCEEKIYASNIIRSEVIAIEESLREGGFNPYIFSVEYFTKEMVDTLAELSPKFVFNLVEEINGKCEHEACVAGLLDMMGIPYTGSDPFALGLALNKFHVKQILRSAGVPTARGFLQFPGQKMRVPRGMRFPLFVKPAHEDASLGINSNSVCHTLEQLENQVQYVQQIYQQEALIEEYLDGREFNVSVIGDKTPKVLAVQEIDFSGMPDGEPKIVSYRAKWDEESDFYKGTAPVCPANIPRRMETRIKDLAIRSHRTLGCRDYSRVDLRTDARGNLYVLEVNPNCDISPGAGFARAAGVAGYSYTDIILKISETAMERGAKVTDAIYAF